LAYHVYPLGLPDAVKVVVPEPFTHKLVVPETTGAASAFTVTGTATIEEEHPVPVQVIMT
jgi:hypothetical protein